MKEIVSQYGSSVIEAIVFVFLTGAFLVMTYMGARGMSAAAGQSSYGLIEEDMAMENSSTLGNVANEKAPSSVPFVVLKANEIPMDEEISVYDIFTVTESARLRILSVRDDTGRVHSIRHGDVEVTDDSINIHEKGIYRIKVGAYGGGVMTRKTFTVYSVR